MPRTAKSLQEINECSMDQSNTMTPAPPPDVWAAGQAYEPYMGRWSRLVARDFVDWLAFPSGAHCGLTFLPWSM